MALLDEAMKNFPRIAAITVNHNTSAYLELMLRSLFATHTDLSQLALTIYDNQSQDMTPELQAFIAEKQIPFIQTGFTTVTQNNSHGELLRRFALATPDCAYYLFLDADICFIEENTIHTMLSELNQEPAAFGIGARMSWDGVHEIPSEVRQKNPDIQDARLHPCCALIKNTLLFSHVVREIGFSAVKYLWAERDEYVDTFKLMTRVMNLCGLRHIFSQKMIVHFFAVSYTWGDEESRQWKAQQRDMRLAALRHPTPAHER